MLKWGPPRRPRAGRSAIPTAAAREPGRLLGTLVAALLVGSPLLGEGALRMSREEAEAFLIGAEVVGSEELDVGVTRSKRLTLRHGERTERAVWKTIDEYRPSQMLGGSEVPDLGFRDSWRNEVAAYELDKLLGLELVPPTVERRIKGRLGSLQLWLEGVITETERRAGGHKPPDPMAWSDQIQSLRLLRQLTYDTDYNNTGNVLVSDDFRIWAIDYSRGFRTRRELLRGAPVLRIRRVTWNHLRALGEEDLKRQLGRWLSKVQLRTLLARRDLLVAELEARIAEHGEAAVVWE